MCRDMLQARFFLSLWQPYLRQVTTAPAAQKKKSLWAGEDLVWRWICRETHAFCKLAAAMLPLNFFDLDLVLDLQSERIAWRTHSSTRHCLLDGVAVSACTCAH